MADMTHFVSKKGPRALGPYSSAVDTGELVFLSGMGPADPETGTIITGDVDVQARRTLDNIGIVLGELGLNFSNVAKTNIYLTDISDFAKINEIYAEYFTKPYPARTTVQVAALPAGISVEIEVVAKK